MESLEDYLLRRLQEAFRYDGLDCCTFAFDWALLRTGKDIMENYRGKYADRQSSVRLYAKHGGLEGVIRYEMDRLGFVATDCPETGDVGIASVPVGMEDGKPKFGPVAAIRAGWMWIVVGEDGLTAYPFDTVAAWKVA